MGISRGRGRSCLNQWLKTNSDEKQTTSLPGRGGGLISRSSCLVVLALTAKRTCGDPDVRGGLNCFEDSEELLGKGPRGPLLAGGCCLSQKNAVNSRIMQKTICPIEFAPLQILLPSHARGLVFRWPGILRTVPGCLSICERPR